MLSTETTAAPTLTIPKTLYWNGDHSGNLVLIDQRQLPEEALELVCTSTAEAFDAILTLAVRGAPAIGVAAAYAVVLAWQERPNPETDNLQATLAHLKERCAYLGSSRPTAVNLNWALARMLAAANATERETASALGAELLDEAHAIANEDAEMCRQLGQWGASVIGHDQVVMTHCNAGALATAGIGTALAGIYTAHAAGKRPRVYACETRPLLQGARITSWELMEAGVDVTLITDNMAAALMRTKGVDLVIVGADRIAANGDAANKIGTYGLAQLAQAHGVRFYVAAPSSTFDLALADGDAIPIEERCPDEVRTARGQTVLAPSGVKVWNPAFDVTPASLITALITEKGIIENPNRERIQALIGG